MKKNHCFICQAIDKIKKNENDFFVAELETGYILIGDYQFFKGYTLFLCKEHTSELHHLNDDFKLKFLLDMSKVGEAVYNAFHAKQLNYDLLGNGDTHLTWHIFPRKQNDSPVQGPVWWVEKSLMFSDIVIPSKEELVNLKISLYNELKKLIPILSKGNF